MTNSQRSLVAFLISFLIAVAAPAQQHLSFEKINYRQGLSHQGIRCIFKDKQGFLWIGTDFGLNRYDGISFKKWFHTDGDSNSLPHNIINSITQDAKGFIWIGTSKGIARMNPFTGQFTLPNDYSRVLSSKSNYDLTIFADSADRIWIGNEKGIYILGVNRKLFKYIQLQLEPEGKRLNNYVYDFLEAGQFIYVSTSYGLYRINKIDFSVTHYLLEVKPGEDPNRNALTRLCKDDKGIVWAGSWFAGLIWFNPQTQSIQRRFIVKATGKNIQGENVIMDVESATENNKVYIYASSYNGLLKIDASSVIDEQLKYQQYLPDKNDPDAIDRQYLSILYKDDLNNLWIATTAGLNKVKIVPGRFRTYSFEKMISADFPPYNIVPAETPGTWWIQAGPNNVLYNPVTSQFTMHPFREEKYSLRQLIKAGNEYFIASKYGLLHFDSRMQLVHVYDTSNTPSLHTQHFNKTFCDSRGNIWLGSYRRGIVLFNQALKTFTSYLHNSGQPVNLTGHDIEGFIEDDHGIIWIATSIGAIQFDYNTKQFTKSDMCGPGNTDDCNKVQCFYQGANGNFYIGSRDGLYLYDYSTRQARRIALNGQGISNRIHNILEDKHGCLWLCTNSGLLWYDPKSLQKRVYSQKDGLPQDGLENAFYKASDSSFWIGTENAITVFNPLQIPQNSIMPIPVFASVNIDDHPFSLIENKAALSIGYNQSIGVDFLSLNYFNTAQNQYQYMVEGLDDHWKNIGNEHTLRFSNLPSGNYTLKIKAANSDGEWNDEPLSLSFNATPPFYKTWWFILLSIATIAAAVYLLYHYRLQQAIKLERIRTRIATDLHDDIGATLSSISMYSDAVKNQVKEKLPHLEPVLEKMGENSRSMVSSMSDIVWAINPGKDEGEQLVHRMESYARDICAIKNVPLTFSAGNRINHVNLSLEYKKNIYLIFKESLNNALKYAGAKHILVSIELTGNTIRLMIKDDGKGFDLKEVRKGNGLKNIQARSQEIGAALLLTSEPGKGTSVELSCVI